jgi:hypothetical protein
MSDTVNIVHYVVTAVEAIVIAFISLKKSKAEAEATEKTVCKADLQALKTEVAVLEERMKNENINLDKLENKLDKILEQL